MTWDQKINDNNPCNMRDSKFKSSSEWYLELYRNNPNVPLPINNPSQCDFEIEWIWVVNKKRGLITDTANRTCKKILKNDLRLVSHINRLAFNFTN